MAIRLADRLSAARREQFVGREGERALFSEALASAELPFHVLFVFGPGGVGKSTLLRELAGFCGQFPVPCLSIDGRNIEATPTSFLSTFEAGQADSSQVGVEGLGERRVLFIDTYETLGALDGWLRETFLPEQPENTLVVIAGREPPSAAWRADAGWQTELRTVPLRNLSPTEARAYLSRRGVPTQQQTAVLDFTHGHALALSLVADGFSQRPETRFSPEAAPDVVQALLQQFLQQVPGPAQRAALEACGLVRYTTEPILADLLNIPDAHSLFEWLRGLSFIENGPLGLYPHDLAREALAADLRWRNPDWYGELHTRARAHYMTRLQQSSAREQQRVLFDYIFLHRDNPVVRPFFSTNREPLSEEQGLALTAERAQPGDIPEIVAMVRAHEGEECAQLATRWLSLQPDSALVCREGDRGIVGILVMLDLAGALPDDLAADPATAAATRYLSRCSPLRSGERATLFRFWMERETYQNVSRTQGVLFVQMVRHYLTTPGLAFTFLPCISPEFWAPVFAYADLARLPDADFAIGGHEYGVYMHDWRATPPLAWLDLMGSREMGATAVPPAAQPTPEAILVLSEPEFAAAVQDALRHLNQPATLRQSPLLRSRFVLERAGVTSGATERIGALETLIREEIDRLREFPRDMKLYRALHPTYLQPAVTQEQAADQLGLPFSTFRRHLRSGITRVTENLWQREIGWVGK